MRTPIPFAIALLIAAAPLAALPLEAENPQGDDLEVLLRSLWLCQDAVTVVDLNYSKALECEVELEFTADELVITASGVPHHDHYSGPGGQGTNGVEPQDYEWRFPLSPTNDTDCNPAVSADGCDLAPELGPVAVALNGAPIYGPEDGPGGDAVATQIGQYEETEQNIWLGICGGHSGPGGIYHYHFDSNCVHWHPENEGETHQVTITDDKDFLPEDLTINLGDTVTWTNDDDSSHTVTAENNQFHSGTMEEGATWSHTFTETGTYDYGCNFHGGMEGSVSVVEEDTDIVWTDYDFSQVDDAVHSPIIGFAFDGYPIYGTYGWGDDSSVKLIRSSYLLNDGAMGEEGIQDYHFEADSGDLDACNGRFSATPEFPDGIYHYYSTPPVADGDGTISTNNAFPYFIYCYRGVPDLSNTNNGGGGEPPGGGPPDDDEDGVSNGWDNCADTPTTVWPDGEPIFPRGCTQAQYDAAGQEPVLDAYSGDNPPPPPDTDGDGIVDPEDECDGSPYGEPVYRNGCTAAQNGGGEEPPPPLAEVCLGLEHDNLSQHFHVSLEIYENGVAAAIPASIGIDTATCPGGMHAIHTHDASGALHVELPVAGPVTLGAFFAIWGEPFSAQQVLHLVADETHTLVLRVDDTAADTWGETLLADGQSIVVEFTTDDGGGTGDPPDDDTGDSTTTEPDPDGGDEPEPDDVGGIPALSLLVTTIALTLIALRRRRSD
jgi:plastocyanin